MTDALSAADVGAAKLSAATATTPGDDDDKTKINPKVASRFVWKKGDITIVNPDGTVVTP
jgi:hypothetical protein